MLKKANIDCTCCCFLFGMFLIFFCFVVVLASAVSKGIHTFPQNILGVAFVFVTQSRRLVSASRVPCCYVCLSTLLRMKFFLIFHVVPLFSLRAHSTNRTEE